MTDARDMPPIPDAPTDAPSRDDAPAKSGRGKAGLIAGLVIVVVAALAIAGYLITTGTLNFGYTATAILEVDIEEAVKAEEGTVAHMIVATHAKLVNTPQVRDRALDLDDDYASNIRLNIRELEWFEADPATASDRLAKMLTVKPVEDTALIAVNVRALDAKTAAILATAVAKAYELNCLDAAESQMLGYLETLQKQKKEIEREAESETLQMRRLTAGSVPPSAFPILQTEHQTMTTRLADLETAQRNATRSLNTLTQAQADGILHLTPEGISLLNLDPAYAALLVRKETLLSEQRTLLSQYADDHPSVTVISDQLDTIQASIAEEEARATANLITTAQSSLAILNEDIALLKADILSTEAKLTMCAKTQGDFDMVKARRDELQEQLGDLETDITRAMVEIENYRGVRMRSMAEVPKE